MENFPTYIENLAFLQEHSVWKQAIQRIFFDSEDQDDMVPYEMKSSL